MPGLTRRTACVADSVPRRQNKPLVALGRMVSPSSLARPMDPAAPQPPTVESALERAAARARGGDSAAFDALFRWAAERVLLYIRLRMGARLRAVAEPEDVLQDTWLAAWRAVNGYQHASPAGLSAWLCRIAESCLTGLADRHDAKKRRAKGADRGPGRIARWADTATGVVTGAARGDESLRMERALESLADDERQVLLLRFFQGLTIGEIAALTGDAATTVRRRIGRATAAL